MAINGTSGNDSLTGTTGADIFDQSHAGGQDTMAGGLGNDTYYVDDAGDVVTETTAGTTGGTDLIISTVSYTLGANIENMTLARGERTYGDGEHSCKRHH